MKYLILFGGLILIASCSKKPVIKMISITKGLEISGFNSMSVLLENSTSDTIYLAGNEVEGLRLESNRFYREGSARYSESSGDYFKAPEFELFLNPTSRDSFKLYIESFDKLAAKFVRFDGKLTYKINGVQDTTWIRLH